MKQFNYKNIFSFLFNTLAMYWYYYFGATICLVLTLYIQSEIPFLARDVVEYLEGNLAHLDLKIFFYYAIGIIIFRTCSRFLFFYPARLIQYQMRLDLIDKIQTIFPRRLEKYSKGQYFQLLISDIDEVRAFIGFAALQVLNIIIALIILLPKLYKFNSNLLIALIPMVISMAIFTFVINKNKKNYSLSQKLSGDLQQNIIETFIGKKTIKNYHNESMFIENFKTMSQEELNNFWKSSVRVSYVMPLFQLGVSLSFLWGSYIIYQQNIGISALVLFSGYIFLFLEPISFLSWITVVFLRSKASWKRLEDFSFDLSTETDLEVSLNKWNKHNSKTSHVLFWGHEVNITIDRPIIALIGKTGSGKSVILEQLAFILQKKYAISYCAQEPYLFDDTLYNNIILGKNKTNKSKEKVLELIKLFELERLADGQSILDLNVGEHGKYLSGGQAKRVALIRSLMMDCNYILWDDPFSSVDIIQERIIWNELKLKKYFQNKTLIFTTHRLTTLGHADKIYMAEKKISKITHFKQDTKALKDFFEEQMV